MPGSARAAPLSASLGPIGSFSGACRRAIGGFLSRGNQNSDTPSSPYLISATCNFLFGSNGAGTASVIHVGAVLRQALTVQGAAPFVFGGYDERRCLEGP